MNTIIIEDDNSIRKGIKILTERYAPHLQIVAEAGTVTKGFQEITNHKPDVLFLDVQLTDGSSFDILTQLHTNFPSYKPRLIFITAYQEYAIKALKCSALDYLLKPIDPTEFKNALQKLKQPAQDVYPQVEVCLDYIQKPNHDKKIALHTQTQNYIVSLKDIVRCESDTNYTRVFLKNEKVILVSKTLKSFDELLHTDGFERIHQSHLVNILYIKTYHKKSGLLELTNGHQLPIATRKREYVNRVLEKIVEV